MKEEKGCSSKWMDIGILFLRLGIGALFLVHGWPKISGGMERWAGLGGAMSGLGIDFYPAFWGFMAAFAEFAGGIMLILGILVRPFAAMMAFTMIVAVVMHVKGGHGLNAALNPGHMVVVFIALMLSGGGRYSLGRWISFLRGKCYQ